jgi:hypothetical protein
MKKILLFILFCFSVCAHAQVSFQFVPEVFGRSLDGLLNVRILNLNGGANGYVTITVNEKNSGNVLKIRTANFNLAQGVNSIPRGAVKFSDIQFPNSPLSVIIRHDNNFPAGDYEYCFTLNLTGNNVSMPEEQCYNYELLPIAEMHLIEPFDRDTLCNKRPTLSWQPLIPGIPGSSYQLVLSEIKKGQNAVEALNYNLPVVNQNHIGGPILPYPSIARELEEGKTYAWQVSAYKNQTVLVRSEVWTFTAHCEETKKPPVALGDDGYREIEDLLKGNYYIAFGQIKFSVINPYQKQDFSYRIESLNDPGKKISNLPKIKLLPGKNKIMIDLTDNDAFKDGESYIIRLTLPDGSGKQLRFIYKN